MIKGADCWPEQITKHLNTYNVGNRDVELFNVSENSIYDFFITSLQRNPDKVFLIDENDNKYTFRQVDALINAFSKYLLTEKNIKVQDRIAVMLYNSIEFVVAFLSILKVGAIMVPIPTKLKKEEINSYKESIAFDLVIVDEEFSNMFVDKDTIISRNVTYGFDGLSSNKSVTFPKITKDFTAAIMFTSGTTSQSKGCVIRNYNMIHAVKAYEYILDIDDSDVAVIGTPFFYVTGLIAVLSLFIEVGGCVVYQKLFNASGLLDLCIKYNATFVHASPTVFMKLLEVKDDFPKIGSLRKFACGASNMPVSRINEIKKWLPNVGFYTVYGLTETTSPGTIVPSEVYGSSFQGSSGKPIPGMDVKIIDVESQKEIEEPKKVGEILLRGANVIENYYNVKGKIDKGGWLRTGDLGYFDENGFIYIVDRIKDMINVGGEKVWTLEIENLIFNLDKVEEVAVVAVTDETYGEKVGAFIKLADNCSMDNSELRNELIEKTAKYKIPTVVKFVEEIPKTENQKVDKKLIRSILEEEKNSVK